MSQMHIGATTETPSEALARRLDDPKVAESLGTLLDHVELLAVLVTGLAGLVARGDSIAEALAAGVGEFKQAAGDQVHKLPTPEEAGQVAAQLRQSLPIINSVLESKMVEPATIQMLAELSTATRTGYEQAKATKPQVSLFGALGALRDPEVQRGFGMLVEIGRALGQHVNQADGNR